MEKRNPHRKRKQKFIYILKSDHEIATRLYVFHDCSEFPYPEIVPISCQYSVSNSARTCLELFYNKYVCLYVCSECQGISLAITLVIWHGESDRVYHGCVNTIDYQALIGKDILVLEYVLGNSTTLWVVTCDSFTFLWKGKTQEWHPDVPHPKNSYETFFPHFWYDPLRCALFQPPSSQPSII